MGGNACHPEGSTKAGYCAPTGLPFSTGFPTQGAALGYGIAPRWGLDRVRREALKEHDGNLPSSSGHTLAHVKLDIVPL